MDWQKLCKDVRFDEPMSLHTSFSIGGPADVFARPQTREELIALVGEFPDAIIIGNGSNLLVADCGVRGVVITTVGLRELRRIDSSHISAQCGALVSAVSSFAFRQGLTGMEFAAGIPGTLGGAIYMNAGAYGSEMANVTISCDYWHNGREHTIKDPVFSYRHSYFSDNPQLIILSAVLKLAHGDAEAIRGRMDDLARRRREKQPIEWPSAGSSFLRPPNGYAAELIESCGLKGYTIGGAQISEKHAGFIINRDNATCEDVRRLIEYVREFVLSQTGIELKPEIKLVGV